MTMFYIILLIVLGLLFLVAELVLLPGVSIGAILALVCYGSSIYLAFRDYGTVAGVVVILAILLESLGFPLEIVGLVASVHAFNDMGNDHD